MANGQSPLEDAPDISTIAKGIVAELVDTGVIEKIWKGQEPVLVKVVEIAVGTVLGLLGTVGAELATAMINAEDIAGPAFNRLANTALKDITGLDVDISTRSGDRGARAGAVRNLGAGILQALSGISSSAAASGGTLEPGTAAAEDYLTFVVQMSLEGWLQDLQGEMFSLGAVETLGNLDDSLANALGLARTSRAVMQPFIDTTVATPARWQMNRTYRPELLSPALAVKSFHRGVWTREQMFEELARQGWSDERIEALINDTTKRPALSLVLRALQVEYISRDEAIMYLRDDGYPEHLATFIVDMEEVEAVAQFQAKLADAAATAYVARRITPARFNQLLSDSGLPSRDMARVRELAELRRALNTKPVSESDAEAAAKRKIISVPEYRQVLRTLGYDEDAVRIKELLTLGDITSAEQKARADAERAKQLADEKAEKKRLADERKAALEAERAVTEPSLAMVERFVTRGHWTFQQYEDFLRAERYNAETIAALVADAEQARVDYLARQEEREAAEARAATRTIGLAQLEQAVLRGHATMSEYRQRLANDKYSATDQEKLVAVLQDRLDERAELERRRADAVQRTADKGVSVAQFEQAVLRGAQTLADFDAFLRAQAYPDFDRSVILQLVQRKLDDQAAAAARRAEVEARAAAARVPVADVRRAVLEGLRPLADYRNALIAANVPADDRQLLEELLQADLDARAVAEDRRAQIERERAERGLSQPQLERAVVAGAATLAQYQQELADDGYDDESIGMLTALLVERIQQTQRARARRDELAARDAATPLSPATVARAVRAGLRSTTDYFNTLLAERYSQEDAELLTALLELELQEAADARQLRTEISDELAGASINIAQMAAAVRAGELSLFDYGQALRERGYTPADVATAVALLDREMEEAGAAAELLDEATEGDKTKQLSVSQFEQAVLAGARSIAEYVQFLDGLQFSLAAQSSLVSLLLQRLDKNAGAA